MTKGIWVAVYEKIENMETLKKYAVKATEAIGKYSGKFLVRGGKILLCDDLSDTGITLNKSVDWLKNYDPIKNKIEDIKTATLWKKKKSTFDPDYCAVKLPDNPWIVQPFEHYEEIRIEDIKKKHSK